MRYVALLTLEERLVDCLCLIFRDKHVGRLGTCLKRRDVQNQHGF
jgi:hypothetical protein